MTLRAPTVVACAVAALLALPSLDARAATSEPTALLDPSRFGALTGAVDARVGLDRRLGADTGASGLGSSCVAVGLPSGETLFSLRGDEPLIPASTTKLYTGLAALAALGPDARFRTEVWDKDGVLFLVGGGDPALATPAWIRDHPSQAATALADLARDVAAERPGARTLVVDAGALDPTPTVEGWESRYLRDLTAPRISALAVDRSRPTLDPAWPKVASGQDDADLAAGSAFAGLYGAPLTVKRGTKPDGATMVASIESPPLSEVVTSMEKYSDNFIAEVLLRQIGRSQGDPTTAGGVRAEAALLSAMGIELEGVRLADGSGLHRDSRVSCDSFLGLLQIGLADARVGPSFAGSLALGGTDGTLKKRNLAAAVRAKTGTLNDVSNLVGTVESGAGDLYFAILMNDTDQSGRAHQVQDRIVGDVGAWPAP